MDVLTAVAAMVVALFVYFCGVFAALNRPSMRNKEKWMFIYHWTCRIHGCDYSLSSYDEDRLSEKKTKHLKNCHNA